MKVQIGKGIDLDVDVPSLPANVMDHVVYIGLRNILMDAHASVKTDEPDYQSKAQAVSQKKLDAMMAGEVRVAGTREGDPVRAEAMRLAIAKIDAWLRSQGRKPSSVDAKVKREKAATLITPELLAKAAERVADAKAVAVDVDLTDL